MKCLLALITFIPSLVLAQIEHERFNALPPGPATISGYVLRDDQPLSEATVRLKCRLNDTLHHRDFQVLDQGQYTAYIPYIAEDVVLLVIYEDEEILEFKPTYYDRGSNQRKNLIIAP